VQDVESAWSVRRLGVGPRTLDGVSVEVDVCGTNHHTARIVWVNTTTGTPSTPIETTCASPLRMTAPSFSGDLIAKITLV